MLSVEKNDKYHVWEYRMYIAYFLFLAMQVNFLFQYYVSMLLHKEFNQKPTFVFQLKKVKMDPPSNKIIEFAKLLSLLTR